MCTEISVNTLMVFVGNEISIREYHFLVHEAIYELKNWSDTSKGTFLTYKFIQKKKLSKWSYTPPPPWPQQSKQGIGNLVEHYKRHSAH